MTDPLYRCASCGGVVPGVPRVTHGYAIRPHPRPTGRPCDGHWRTDHHPVTPAGGVQRPDGRSYADPGDGTWLDVVRAVLGPVPDVVADWMLWNATPFPFGQRSEIVASLEAVKASLTPDH